jgi:Zn-dependent peptidase ImmA (M78 family)
MPNLNNNLSLMVEWEDPCSAKGEELRATWCRLAISVGQTPITRIEDERAQTVRDAVYCSAYPLAEWFAFNWWSLLNETERPSSATEKHNVRFAREGFALPSLELFSEDSFVRAIWKPYRPTAAPVRFLNEGFALMESKAVAQEIAAFVDKVVARLQSKGVVKGCLIDEWMAIRETSEEEKEFCETTGALGLDPYDLEDKKAEEIISVARNLPAELKREFFLAADSTVLTQQAKWVAECLRELEDYEAKTKLAGKKGLYYGKQTLAATAWQTGYDLAREFRKDFRVGINVKKPLDVERLCGAKKGYLPVIRIGEEHQLDAVAKLSNDAGPQIATSKTRESSKTYLMARSICDYLCSNSEESALLTRVGSDRQKRNRAFAAEMLAPAEGIRQLLSGSRIARDEIGEIAAHFNASEWLIEHQVINHRIAEIEDTPPSFASESFR